MLSYRNLDSIGVVWIKKSKFHVDVLELYFTLIGTEIFLNFKFKTLHELKDSRHPRKQPKCKSFIHTRTGCYARVELISTEKFVKNTRFCFHSGLFSWMLGLPLRWRFALSWFWSCKIISFIFRLCNVSHLKFNRIFRKLDVEFWIFHSTCLM